MSIDPKLVEITADVLKMFLYDTSTRTHVIRGVDRSNSSFCIAFGAVQKVFLISSVLGVHVNLI